MKKTITLEQSKQTTLVKPKFGGQKAEPQHSYTVTKLQGTTEPPIGETLSKDQVETLIRQRDTTVNINPKK